MFRNLTADEIDCRIATVKKNGVSLLLYKDARVDQNILDETFGVFGWQRSHQLIGDRLYCTISVWDADKAQWISKQDVGTESYTEKEKGQASDSFKRAAFNFGIGRELYTAPFIWIDAADCNIKENQVRYTCYDRFSVRRITIKAGKICGLEIVNENTGKTVYQMGSREENQQMIEVKKKAINALCVNNKVDLQTLLIRKGLDWDNLTEAEADSLSATIKKGLEKNAVRRRDQGHNSELENAPGAGNTVA